VPSAEPVAPLPRRPLPAAFTALAAGTFLHMGAVEILADELAHNEHSAESGETLALPKVCAAFCGLGAMAVLATYV